MLLEKYSKEPREVRRVDPKRYKKYEDFFTAVLKAWGVSSINELDRKEKKRLFDYVEKTWEESSYGDEEE